MGGELAPAVVEKVLSFIEVHLDFGWGVDVRAPEQVSRATPCRSG